MAFAIPLSDNAFKGRSRGNHQVISHCPICQSFYYPSAARVLVQNEEAHLIHLECTKCGCAVLAIIMINMLGVSSVGLLTDCTPEDVMRFSLSERVDTDDLINLHQWLQKNLLSKYINHQVIQKNK
ncbi:MAG: hypothetical protein V1853_04210 [bacterium]